MAVIAVLAVVAVALGVVLVTGGDDDDPSGQADGPPGAPQEPGDDPGAGGETGDVEATAWTTPANESTARGDTIRVLATGDDLVHVTQREITSIDRATGEKNWVTDMSATGETAAQPHVLCGASSTASDDGQLAVTLGFDDSPTGTGDQTVYGATCGLVALIDLETGEFGASVQVAFEGGGTPNPGLDSGMPVEFVGDTLLVTWYATIFGLDATDLSTRWEHRVGTERGWEEFDCSVDDMALGDADNVIVLNTCISEVGETPIFLDELSAATGEPGRTHEFTPAEGRMSTISSLFLVMAVPVVVHFVAVEEGDTDALVTLDDSWNVLSVINDGRMGSASPEALTVNGLGFLNSLVGAWRQPSRSMVTGTTLVSMTAPSEDVNSLVGVDLTTGENLWSTPAPDGHKFWQVIAAADGSAVAVASEGFGPNQALITVDVATGEVTDQRDTPVPRPGDPELGPTSLPDVAWVHADDRAYGVDYDHGGDENTWLAFAIG